MENSPVVSQPVPRGSRKRRRVVLNLLLLFGILGTGVWNSWAAPDGALKPGVKELSAARFAKEIAGAISSYYADYDALPLSSHAADWVGTTEAKNGLIAILAAWEKPDGKLRNPKCINYLDGFKQAKKDDSGKGTSNNRRNWC